MEEELKEINDTLQKIERKIEDKSYKLFDFKNFFNFEKRREEELLEIQKQQTKSIRNQEEFNKMVAFTGVILALTSIYKFIVESTALKEYPRNYWIITIIFLLIVILCLTPLTKFVIKFWKEETFLKI